MLNRVQIPVRDGLRPAKRIRPRWLPEAGQHEYRSGFWLGYGAGLCWGAILATIVVKVLL